jgi:hypothetical protein
LKFHFFTINDIFFIYIIGEDFYSILFTGYMPISFFFYIFIFIWYLVYTMVVIFMHICYNNNNKFLYLSVELRFLKFLLFIFVKFFYKRFPGYFLLTNAFISSLFLEEIRLVIELNKKENIFLREKFLKYQENQKKSK